MGRDIRKIWFNNANAGHGLFHGHAGAGCVGRLERNADVGGSSIDGLRRGRRSLPQPLPSFPSGW